MPWHDGQHTSTRLREQSGEGLTHAGVEEEAHGLVEAMQNTA